MEGFLPAFIQRREGGNLLLSGSGRHQALSSQGAAFQINVSDLSCKTPQL